MQAPRSREPSRMRSCCGGTRLEQQPSPGHCRMTHSLMLRLQQLAFYQRSWPPESANHAEKERHLSELTSAFLSRMVCSHQQLQTADVFTGHETVLTRLKHRPETGARLGKSVERLVKAGKHSLAAQRLSVVLQAQLWWLGPNDKSVTRDEVSERV